MNGVDAGFSGDIARRVPYRRAAEEQAAGMRNAKNLRAAEQTRLTVARNLDAAGGRVDTWRGGQRRFAVLPPCMVCFLAAGA